ncbi:MAG: aspartate carbamoyltransferase [Sulfolobaceae archaeon]|nr:aspartate carbamoyltransferase [Sulfolobaceae archaeon]
MRRRSIIGALDLTKEEYEELFSVSDEFKRRGFSQSYSYLEGKVVSLAFFEPSTRTRMSFETAALKLGAKVIGFSGEEGISVAKGENLADTIRMLSSYSDLIVMRHKFDGAARFATEVTDTLIINGGDGKHEHPTQAMVDLYAVREVFSSPSNLVYGILGDLKYARTVNSLLRALTLFQPKFVYLISPPQLRARREILDTLNYPYKEVQDINEVISELDVLYVTRIQKERFADEMEYEKVRESYELTYETVTQMKRDAIILHPLPRVTEIDRRIDKTPHARYFMQANLAVYLRMGLLYLLLGEKK